LRSSSIFKIIEVVFNFQKWWCGAVFLTNNNTTPTKVVLSCLGLLLGCGNTDEVIRSAGTESKT
jgi:hypothetical protein